MKRFVSVFLVFIVLIGLFPNQANAASSALIEVVVENAPIREKPYQEGKVIARCEVGSVLESTGSLINSRMNKWYKVNYNGLTCYIYSENITQHTHSYQILTIDNITFKICDCGKIVVRTEHEQEEAHANMFASYAGAAALSASADGPIPIGDIIAVGLLIFGAYETFVGMPLTRETLSSVVEELDFSDYLRDNRNVCSDNSYRMVSRAGGKLTYINDWCLNIGEAYVYVRYANGDVYTKYQTSALALAALNGTYYMERDKDKPDYYYHYHLGADAKSKVGGHIFFGETESGLTPT